MFKKLIGILKKNKDLEEITNEGLKQSEELEEVQEQSPPSYTKWVRNSLEEVEVLKNEIKSIDSGKIYKSFESLLDNPSWKDARSICNALK